MRPAKLAFWISLSLPSAFVVQKYLGWTGLGLYGLGSLALVAFSPVRDSARGQDQARRRVGHRWGVSGTLAALLLVLLTVHPAVNTHSPGAGSDDDDAYDLGARALLVGHSPYAKRTYLGNVLHQLPGAFVLAAPFVLAGTSALQNVFWLAAFFWVVRLETSDDSLALRLAWVVLLLSPTVLHQVVTGTAHLANTIYVCLATWWLSRSSRPSLVAIAFGVALASRANFLFLIPVACGWLWRRHGRSVALRATTVACVTVMTLTLPFYLWDPANFGPLEASDRLLRFDALVPHLGALLMLAMAAIAVGLAFRKTDRVGLFWNCAIVQAFPVIAGLILSSLQDGRVDLAYAAYGTFFSWFVLMALALSSEPNADRTVLSAASVPDGALGHRPGAALQLGLPQGTSLR